MGLIVSFPRPSPYANITHHEASKQATYAAVLHEQAGLGSVPFYKYSSEWVPWEDCDQEAFAKAGIGLSTTSIFSSTKDTLK